jgi:ribosomal protein S6--L-glutamate ligase
VIIDPLRCYMNIATAKPTVHYNGRSLEPDAVIPRIGASITFYGTAVVRQFEMMGVYSLNETTVLS